MPNARHDDDLAYVRAGMPGDLETVLVFNLLRTFAHLAPWLDAELRPADLTAAQLNTLLLLRAAGDKGLLMGQVGQRLVVAKSNVTGLIDRLERQGLAERAEHRDRRATIVRITDSGVAVLDRTAPRMAALAEELTGCLTAAEKTTLAGLLTKLRRELRQRRGRQGEKES